MEPSLTAGACFDLIEHGLRRARDVELARQMVNHTFLDIWLQRRCQLCAKQYTPDPLPAGELFDDRPPRCPDCMTVIDRVAVEAKAVFGDWVDPNMIAAFAARYITHQPFQYGRPWQDHVPTHNRHLIEDTP